LWTVLLTMQIRRDGALPTMDHLLISLPTEITGMFIHGQKPTGLKLISVVHRMRLPIIRSSTINLPLPMVPLLPHWKPRYSVLWEWFHPHSIFTRHIIYKTELLQRLKFLPMAERN